MDVDNILSKATTKIQLTSQQLRERKATKCATLQEGTTRKIRLRKKFSRKMAATKKKFVPLKLREQSDPLYAKLKEYHDSLLRSVNNMTTEKISGEVEQVVQDTAVIDDCSRPFQWTEDEQNRLNELNELASCLNCGNSGLGVHQMIVFKVNTTIKECSFV